MRKIFILLIFLLLLGFGFTFATTSGTVNNIPLSVYSNSVNRFKTLQNQFFCKDVTDQFKTCNSTVIGRWEALPKISGIVNINGKNICIVKSNETTDITQCNTTYTSLQSGKWYNCAIKDGVENCTDANEQTSYEINNSEWHEVNDDSGVSSSTSHCTLNGQIVPCEQLQKQAFSIFKYFAGFGLLILILGIAGTVFWIVMLVDIIKHEEKDKPLWILILIFFNVIGAVVYYFKAKKHRNNEK